MDTRTALGRNSGRDSDYDDSDCDQAGHLSLSQPHPLQLDHPRQSSQMATHTPLPSLPESPLATARMSATSPNASAARPGPASASDSRVFTVSSTSALQTTPSAVSTSAPATPIPLPPTIRAVTPELHEQRRAVAQDPMDSGDLYAGPTALVARSFGTMTPHGSPRNIAGPNALSHHSTSSRRQGIVFGEDIVGSFDGTVPSPPPRPSAFRPRTHTMDGAPPFRESSTSASPVPESKHRNRVSSFSSTSTADSSGRLASITGPSLDPICHPWATHNRPLEAQITTTITSTGAFTASSSAASISSASGLGPTASPTPVAREKRSANKRLIKRVSSRPTSPVISVPPSIDSLASPISTNNPNKVLMLMNRQCGRMRGEIEYWTSATDTAICGISYVDEEKGRLMFDPGDHNRISHTVLVPDLRGCHVSPGQDSYREGPLLEVANAQATVELVFRPLVAAELDMWLASLICWQQVRPTPGVTIASSAKTPGTRSGSVPEKDGAKKPVAAVRLKESTIIKVGKILIWNKGVATSPRAVVKRPSTGDLKSTQTAWRHVSCILRGDGEFILTSENDAVVLSVIELSQLARCAVQQLDKTVLDVEYCIAIYPVYASSSTRLSIFRPMYVSFDSRVAFEVWFVLLRAFTVPDIYSLDSVHGGRLLEMADIISVPDIDAAKSGQLEEPQMESTGDSRSEASVATLSTPRKVFRLENSLSLRVTEAKIKLQNAVDAHERSGKHDHDPSIGNYLAEVVLDGEIRARTTTQTETKNPFWREDCDFTDLPTTLPFLSIVVKKIDSTIENLTHHLQATFGLPKSGNLREVLFGAVDIPLNSLERGKDHEQWMPIHDDQQQIVGTMFVKVHHEELAVLPGREYKPILDMLHRFSTSLTLQIAEAMPGFLRRLAEVFLNIFQVSGNVGDWIMALVEDEIDGIGNQTSIKKMRFSRRLKSTESAESLSEREQIVRDMGKSLQGEANLLFRGNSLLTQALEFHMRRLGKEYLDSVLSAKINEINEINPDCEVDPSKIQPGDDISKHWARLTLLTNEVWECIAASASQFPAELRQILKYIRAVAEDRYGGFLRTVSYTSVSGFLFLRFVCPAILNPKLFGLLRDHPRPRAQRTLTLIAKGLQALANLSTIGNKETWMEPMNRFLTMHRQSVKDFIDAICAIPAEKPNMSTLGIASYSTPITIMGRLPMMAREGLPSLPYLIDHPRNLAALVKLWSDARPVSAERRICEGELLEFSNACADIQAKSDECLRFVEEQHRADSGGESKSEESVAVTLDKARLSEMASQQLGGNVPAWMESNERAGGMRSSVLSNSRNGGLVPPSSSGSDVDDPRGWNYKSRQTSFGSTSQAEASGSIKILRNGRNARKFLSGIIGRKPRPTSPDIGSEAALGIRKEEQQEDERGRDRESKGPSSKYKATLRDKSTVSELSETGGGRDDKQSKAGKKEKQAKPGKQEKHRKHDKSAKSERSGKDNKNGSPNKHRGSMDGSWMAQPTI